MEAEQTPSLAAASSRRGRAISVWELASRLKTSALFSEALECFTEVFLGLKVGSLGFGIAVPGPNGVGGVPKGAAGRASLARVMQRGPGVVEEGAASPSRPDAGLRTFGVLNVRPCSTVASQLHGSLGNTTGTQNCGNLKRWE